MHYSAPTARAAGPGKTAGRNAPISLQIKDFAHLADVSLSFGDLTVVVGPQGAGKSLAFQWLKTALDGRQIVDQLRAAGHPADRTDASLKRLLRRTTGPCCWNSTRVEKFNLR